ncbi:MAG: putative Rrf2 family DNA-binding protein [Fusobacteria bacterium]|nr:MAG: putative Rrf2 family DNA-binding protein [Fusobacteriota bacterium]KAF0228701.1 MAG: putative Rrf2 family DNA-binding [Fusobacteriota bacterium]
MKVSTKGRYAIRLMIDIGIQNNGYVRLKDVAKRQEISIKYLEQIVGSLQKAGLLLSSRGAQGGYRLAKDPAEYNIGEILRATEGSVAPVSCLDDEVNKCGRSHICTTLDFWQGLYDVINDYLDSHNLAELMEIEKNNQQKSIDYSI